MGGATGPHAVAQPHRRGLFATGHVTRAIVVHMAHQAVLQLNKLKNNKKVSETSADLIICLCLVASRQTSDANTSHVSEPTSEMHACA